MRALYVTPEIYPLIKTGGLADVSAALPASLAALGADVHVMVPAYPRVLDEARAHGPAVPLGDVIGAGEVSLISAQTPDTGVPLWLVDCPPLYQRPGRLYQDAECGDWPDNDLRFAVLSHAAARLAQGVHGLSWRPDIVHANDWQTALAPMLLAQSPSPRPATVFTMHNLAFQGLFPLDRAKTLRLPPECVSPEGIEFYGRLSFLKAGIRHADVLTTVSRTYASEIQTLEFGCGLEGLLRARRDRLSGIPNGVDYGIWNPWTDPHLPQRYDVQRMAGKRACKETLQRELNLTVASDVPLVAFVSRITEQKMADVVVETLSWLVDVGGAQFALVGEGDPALECRFMDMAERHPGKVSIHIGYEESLAHRLHAGADILLHPSRFEPGGLVPLYAMRYGTVPIVRRVGGLADSVVDADANAVAAGGSTGFAFTEASDTDLRRCLERALVLYRQPVIWRRIQSCGMKQDFGWRKPARTYFALYEELTEMSAREADISANGMSIIRFSNATSGSDAYRGKHLEEQEESVMKEDLDSRIRERAYEIWERENRPHGKHEEHWLCAKAEIEAELAQERSRTDAVATPKRSRSKTVGRTKRRAG